jgi:hypothetical protein
MNVRGLAVCLVIACGLGACTTAPAEPRDEPKQLSDEPTAASIEALTGPATNAECLGDSTCPAQFPDDSCIPLGDFDCGEEFCRTPGVQCGGQPSTFIRVGHVFRCFDGNGNTCDKVTQGRRLVHCGC